jgi:hypothetical protein
MSEQAETQFDPKVQNGEMILNSSKKGKFTQPKKISIKRLVIVSEGN